MSFDSMGNPQFVSGTGNSNYFCPSCGCTVPGVHWQGCGAFKQPASNAIIDIRIAEALERIAKALEQRPL